MKAAELIPILQEHPDWDIVMQKDAEGNGYSPLAGAEPAKYRAETTWSGNTLHPDDIASGYYDQDEVDSAEDVFVLWPTN